MAENWETLQTWSDERLVEELERTGNATERSATFYLTELSRRAAERNSIAMTQIREDLQATQTQISSLTRRTNSLIAIISLLAGGIFWLVLRR